MATVHGGGHFGSVRPPRRRRRAGTRSFLGDSRSRLGSSPESTSGAVQSQAGGQTDRAPLIPPPRLRLLLGNLDDHAESGVAESPGQPRMEPADGTLAVFLASTSMRVFQDAAAAALDASVTLLLAPSFVSLKSAPRSCCPLPLKRFPNASP